MFDKWKSEVDEKLKEEKQKKLKQERRAEEAKKDEKSRKREDAESAYEKWYGCLLIESFAFLHFDRLGLTCAYAYRWYVTYCQGHKTFIVRICLFYSLFFHHLQWKLADVWDTVSNFFQARILIFVSAFMSLTLKLEENYNDASTVNPTCG